MAAKKRGLNLGRHNPRLTLFSSVIAAHGKLPGPRKSTDWCSRIKTWDIKGNDQYGDCVFCSWLDMRRIQAAATGRSIPDFGTTDALQLYEQVVRTFNRNDPSTDVGSDFDAEGAYLRRTGQIISQLRIHTTEQQLMELANDWLGPLTIGGALPDDFEERFDKAGPGGLIDIDAKFVPNPYKGHQMVLADRRDGAWQLVTWGTGDRFISPAAVAAMTAPNVGGDCQAVVTNHWIRDIGLSPSELHLATIERDAGLLANASA